MKKYDKNFKKQTVKKYLDGQPVSLISREIGVNENTIHRIGGITYLPLQNGKFCYLATFQDKFTRRVVGWKISTRMTAQIVIDAFNRARSRGLINSGARLFTPTAAANTRVQNIVDCYIFTATGGQSRRKAKVRDNAPAESFFSRFKTELIEGGSFEVVEQAKSEIFSYIEGYYNRIRRHSSLGYLSPMEFEKQLKIKNKQRRWDDELNDGGVTLMLRNVGVERQEAELSCLAICDHAKELNSRFRFSLDKPP